MCIVIGKTYIRDKRIRQGDEFQQELSQRELEIAGIAAYCEQKLDELFYGEGELKSTFQNTSFSHNGNGVHIQKCFLAIFFQGFQ